MTIEPKKKTKRRPNYNETTYENFYGFHRTDGPAYEKTQFYDEEKKKPRYIQKEWLINNVKHRVDGPCREITCFDKQGNITSYSWEFRQNNVFHREDGPAVYCDKADLAALDGPSQNGRYQKDKTYGWFLNGEEVGHKKVLENAKTVEQELNILSYILQNK